MGYDVDNYIGYNWSKGQSPVSLEVKRGDFISPLVDGQTKHWVLVLMRDGENSMTE